MGVEVPIFLTLGISIVFYLVGFCSPALIIGGFCQGVEQLSGTLGTDSPAASSGIESILSIFSNLQFLGLIGIATVSAILLGGNFNILSVFPIFLAVVAINFFILPISFIFTLEYDATLKIIFGLLLNALIVMSIVEFVRR